MHRLFTLITIVLVLACVVSVQGQQHLLYEPDAPDYRFSAGHQSLFDKLAPDPSLSTFMDVLTQVDDLFALLNATRADQPFTVFCPVNAAFRHQVDAQMRSDLASFLRNHIVPTGSLDPPALRSSQTLKTMLQGETIQVKYHLFSKRTTLNGNVMVDTAHPVEATNGIAYKIDHLLRPAK